MTNTDIAPYAGSADDPLFAFQAREAAIAQKKRRLVEVMKQYADQAGIQTDPGRMVSGHYVAPSWAQGLNQNVVQPLQLEKAIRQLETGIQQDTSAYEQDDRRRSIEHAMSRPGVATSGEDREGNPIVPPATPQATAKWAQEGMAIPSRRGVLEKVMADLEVNAPIRDEARQVRQQDRAEDRQFREEGRKEAMAARLEELRIRMEDRGLDRASREQMAREANELRKQIAAEANQTRRDVIAQTLEAKAEKTGAGDKVAERAAATKVTEANEALALIKQAGPLINSSTGSYIGKGLDMLGQAFGYATPGSIAASELQAIEGALVAKMPKMSGPQSDKDVLLYKQMAGQIGDPTIPASRKQAALKQIAEIQRRYASSGGASGTWEGGAPSIGEVRKGYRYNGGDPAQQSSWTKQ